MKSLEPFRLDDVIRSEMLGVLRKIDWFLPYVDSLAQFTIVVDANIILGDLVWLIAKRKNPEAVTELMECISAGTVTAYISRSVLNEIVEHIPKIASSKRISPELLHAEWKKYRKLLKVRSPKKSLVNKYVNGQDPDDAPTLALADMVRACGILSKDSDITAMGGAVIELSFMQAARSYSRKTAISATIHFTGACGFIVTESAIKVAVDTLTEFVKSIPKSVLFVIFVAILIILANQKLREKVIDLLRPGLESIQENGPRVLDFLARIGVTLSENHVPAPAIRVLQPTNRGSST